MIIDKTLKEYIKQNVCNELKKEHSQRPSNDHWTTMKWTIFDYFEDFQNNDFHW